MIYDVSGKEYSFSIKVENERINSKVFNIPRYIGTDIIASAFALVIEAEKLEYKEERPFRFRFKQRPCQAMRYYMDDYDGPDDNKYIQIFKQIKEGDLIMICEVIRTPADEYYAQLLKYDDIHTIARLLQALGYLVIVEEDSRRFFKATDKCVDNCQVTEGRWTTGTERPIIEFF